MKMYVEIEVYLYAVLTSVLDGGEWSGSCPGSWYPLDRRLSGPQSQSGCGGKEKTTALLGIKPKLSSP